jgi:hypothetical protein
MSTVETATEIRSFHVEIPEEKLAELRRRIAATRWPSKELVEDPSQGVQSKMLQELARSWETDYDWRKVEAEGGIGHNLPQEAPDAFAAAILEAGGAR